MGGASSEQSKSRSSAAAVVPVEVDDNRGHRRHGGGGAQQAVEEAAVNKAELRRGPWTVDEDLTLVNYIADNGEGRWNSLAHAAGLKRTGKSCRLRWLNYLRPDVKRGNFSADEQLLILDLHTRWGNRWSKIAQHLPGRTDNEIKNYWRTRVQKHAKQLNCDANSKRFKDAMRYLWMPHLVDIAAADDDEHHHHHLRLLHQQQQAVAGDDHYFAAGAGGYAADVQHQQHALSSSPDSLASESCCYEDDGGLFASMRAAGETTTTTMLMMNGGGGSDWAKHEANQQGLWPPSDHDQSVPVQQHQAAAAAAGGGQFQDPELSGWVQGFSESIVTDNFWALEEIWKMH